MATASRGKSRSTTGVGKKRSTKKKAASARKISRVRKPAEMDLQTWQTELRRQFGADQDFEIKNLGDEPFFSEFEIRNPESLGSYRVAIRGEQLGVNFCSCADFATNNLGTCKHIEFTLAKLRRKRGGKRALAEGFQPAYSEIYLQYGAEREVKFRPGGDCPVELARLAGRYFDEEGGLRAGAVDRIDRFLNKTARIDHEVRVYDDARALLAELRDVGLRDEILRKEFPRGAKSAAFKKLLAADLYDYQREGALFAARAGRTLIGDEMGLGKTIQAIAAAEIMARHFGVERVLIICPTSLKHQWESEIGRFIKRAAKVIGGPRPKRIEQYAQDGFFKITNYDTVHRDLDLIRSWSPDLVILDEAQRIKNWSTRAARSVKQISSPYCIVLTGTPIENRLEELVSIVQFIDQHRLGPTFEFLHRHQQQEENTGRVVGYRDLDKVAETLKPILVRRRKDEVLDQLPGRLEKYFFTEMTPQQWAHHEENQETVARIVQKWQRYGFLSESDQTRLMIALQNMRMSCNSTFLLDHRTDYGAKSDELATLLEEMFEQPEAKAVVFSQWVRTHELIVRRLKQRGWGYVEFNGSVPSAKRKALIERFRGDRDCRLFLSTDAGGVGLNLQHASAVVNMDLPWNPAVLEQRIGRVHRLGQKRPVQVINFVAENTIEHGMISLLGFKKSLFAGILDGGEKNIFLGGTRLKRFMEGVEKATSSIPSRGDIETAAPPSQQAQGNGEEKTPAEQAASPQGQQSASATADPLAGLVQSGLDFLQQLAAVAARDTEHGGNGKASGAVGPLRVERSDENGQTYLKVPMPSPESIETALSAIRALITPRD